MPLYKTKTKKDGLQGYRVRVNFTSPSGESKQLTRMAYGLEAAKDLERRLENEYSDPQAYTASMTFRSLCEEYQAQKKHTVRESTFSKEDHIIQNHILPFFADQPLKKINIQLLQKWKLEIEQKNLSVAMKNNIFQPLNSILRYAVKMDYLPRNPLEKLGRFRDAYAAKQEMNYYTPEEWQKFKTAAETAAQSAGFYEWNYYVFFALAFYCGLRKGEIHALKWTDLDDNTLRIRRSISQKLTGDDRETPPKNRTSSRDLQIPAPLAEILNQHLARYRAVPGFTKDWRICGGTAPLRDTTVSNRNIQYANDAGIKTIRIHDFRHSHASLLANEGINIQEIARRLGHSKIEITWNTYSHLYPREEERAIAILNRVV